MTDAISALIQRHYHLDHPLPTGAHMMTTATNPCTDFSIDALILRHGSHGAAFHGEACLVEASCQATICDPTLAERFGRPEKFGDDHPSISRVVRAYAIALNDNWSDEDRQKLRPYTLRILGTKTTDADDLVRSWMAVDWLTRSYTPAWLRLASLTDEARVLESLTRIVDATTATDALPSLNQARIASAAARAAAWDAARAAAGDAAVDAAWAVAWDAARAAARAAAGAAARAAAWDAARAAARDAAWDAAWAAARAAAWDAAWDATGDAAWAAARDAAWDAARAAAWAAAWDAAVDAAWDAARAALRPTVEALQVSALDLFDRMIAVGRE